MSVLSSGGKRSLADDGHASQLLLVATHPKTRLSLLEGRLQQLYTIVSDSFFKFAKFQDEGLDR